MRCKLEILHATCQADDKECRFYNKDMDECNIKQLLTEIYMENKNKVSRNNFISDILEM